ncbi:MAG: hypothetical protein Q7T71_14835, partial [Herbiconiux sp.]|nr:hypothetical protein [Herbiconiux sp.]
MTPPDFMPEGSPPFAVQGLSAAADPANAVWLLVGSIHHPQGGEGQLAVWATTADPTQDSFDGTLRSVGGQTAQISSAPGIQFPAPASSGSSGGAAAGSGSVSPGGFPAAAL